MREGGLGLHHIFSGEHTPTCNRLSRDAWGSQVVSHTAFHREFFPSPERDGEGRWSPRRWDFSFLPRQPVSIVVPHETVRSTRAGIMLFLCRAQRLAFSRCSINT